MLILQDFTQAELLSDLRVVPENSLFYCGDTSQTIARGIGFRFADIVTLFYDEQQRRQVPPLVSLYTLYSSLALKAIAGLA